MNTYLKTQKFAYSKLLKKNNIYIYIYTAHFLQNNFYRTLFITKTKFINHVDKTLFMNRLLQNIVTERFHKTFFFYKTQFIKHTSNNTLLPNMWYRTLLPKHFYASFCFVKRVYKTNFYKTKLAKHCFIKHGL